MLAMGPDKIHVFEVKEEELSLPPPVPVIVPEPVVAAAPVPPEVDEVTEIVTKERRLLPIFFDTDSYSIKEEAMVTLDKDIQWLKQNIDVSIMIRGYADRTGSYIHNFDLSEKRAREVMEFFEEHDIDPNRMSILPMGTEDTDTSEEGLKGARRVDFLVK